jgi:beta-lactamase class A
VSSVRIAILAVVLVGLATCDRPAALPPLQRLHSRIETITKSVKAKWGVYIKCVETGEEIALNADALMDTMSVIKIPLMVEVFRQIEASKLGLSERVTLYDWDKRAGSGVMRTLDGGATFSIKDLLYLMIIASDNTATDLLYTKVGGIEPVNELMRSYGLANIRAIATTGAWFDALGKASSMAAFHREGRIRFGLASARDMGRLLERIARGEAVSRDASALMMDMLRNQQHRTRLPKHVTELELRVAHKAGDFFSFVANDVGVFEWPERHVIVAVFAEQAVADDQVRPSADVDDAIALIGKEIVAYFR